MELVLVTWWDTITSLGWESSVDDLRHDIAAPIYTVGFLMAEDDETLTLVADYQVPGGDMNRRIIIPKGCIKSRVDLDLLGDEDDDDDYLVVGDDTSYADLYDPPDSTTTTASHTEDTPHCAGPI